MERFKTNNDKQINVVGTSLKGYIDISYDHLKEVFGEPCSPCDKIEAEWDIEFEDGSVATIYSYKETNVEDKTTHWHIGGNSSSVVYHVAHILKEHNVSYSGVQTVNF